MRKTVAATLAAVLVVAVLATSGCGLFTSPTEQANGAISDANVHLRKYDASLERTKKWATQLNSKPAITAEEATAALALVTDLKKESAVQRTELQAASKEIAKVKTFDVKPSFKKYADLEIAAINAQIAVIDEGDKYYSELERFYVAVRDGKSTSALAAEILTKVDEYSANIKKLTDIATKAASEADTYFDKTADEG